MKAKIIARKILFVLFLLCFLPYVFVLAVSTYYAIAGYEVRAFLSGELIKTLYGAQAFAELAIFLLAILWYFAIIPICLAYQVIYVIAKLILSNKKKNGD